MSLEPEGNNRLLQDVLARPGNGTCADCGNPEPDWASLTLGVFVCQACSLLHRSIPHISRVKSVQDTWDASDVELMATTGNNAAKAKYEQKVPAFYYRPTHTDCKMLREQWIRAKYERNEFEFIEKQEPYSAGYREGFLWKRGRDNGQFFSRRFILSEREGALKYFNKQDARDPKALMKIETLNATFQPAKIGNPCGLQITYLKDNSTRNIFVYHSDAKEMIDWFNAIRAARFHYLQVAFPGASDEELVPKLTRNFMKEGFMEKTGPKHTEGFKKRWFTMDDRRLMYFKDPLDAFARGEVFIGSKENSYTVLSGLPSSTQGHHWNNGITIVTPDRKFLFACETEAEQRDWIAAFQRVINRPMRPQEYAVEAHFKHKP
ncbi:arf-GAP with dual PH domain-containing protein 1-like isoform X1 [Anarrhichthys ocellatus]|uniref:arf-GAP with dual PH domain-containing protein 1-like isoform X1 n=2 Tax=Anarrhichthys ocellatus TaxID=433405 RepID=UPI0012EE9F0C|nr:arf-GAP with dual PH domain-containing protein 1-like isoform X1 [Anarrhichthys ocellatus]